MESGVTGNFEASAIIKPRCFIKKLEFPKEGPSPFVYPNGFQGVYGYYPNQIRNAYGLNKIPADGSGETIVLLDCFDYPQAISDFKVFDQLFRINRPGKLSVLYGPGTTGNYDNDSSFELESSLDVQWAHAIAPGANLVLILMIDNFHLIPDGVELANSINPTIVSMSFGESEFSGETTYDPLFSNGSTGTTVYLASSGDVGGELQYPACSPYVIGVGGTELFLTNPGSRFSPFSGVDPEIAWNESGGGVSVFEPLPSFQNGVTGVTGTGRNVPDVSFNGAPATGVPIYNTFSQGATGAINGWGVYGGTSLSCPCFAGVVALANQIRVRAGKSRFTTQTLQSALYNIYNGPSNIYNESFYDIIQGSAGSNPAMPGYDRVTGLGTPQNQNPNVAMTGLVYQLAYVTP